MSADNVIYVGRWDDGYRIAHHSASLNFNHEDPPDYLFKDSGVYHTQEDNPYGRPAEFFQFYDPTLLTTTAKIRSLTYRRADRCSSQGGRWHEWHYVDDTGFVRERIRYVCSFKKGWLEGDGEDIDIDPVFVEQVVRAFEAAGMGTPSIFPIEEGHVGLEWRDGREIEIMCGPFLKT